MNISVINKNIQWKRTACTSLTFLRGIGTDPRLVRDRIFKEVEEIRLKDVQPTKLLMVWRVAPVKNRPYWEKKIIREHGMDIKMHEPVILKNTPSICESLMQVKHLIRVKPVTFPYGEPSKDGDFTGTMLKYNGEFVVSKKLNIDPQRLIESPRQDVKMDKKTLSKEMLRKWAI